MVNFSWHITSDHFRLNCMNPNCALDHHDDHCMTPLVLNGTEFSLLREREPLPEESIWMCQQVAVELEKAAQLTELQVCV